VVGCTSPGGLVIEKPGWTIEMVMAKLSTRPSRRADEQDEAPSPEAVEAFLEAARRVALDRPERSYGSKGRQGPSGRGSRRRYR